MSQNVWTGALAALVASLVAGVAAAGISAVDPGLYTSFDEVGQARIRLDQGNSQTWKAAFWRDLSMLSNSGVQGPSPAVWSNATTYDWSISYNATTGVGNIRVLANQTVETSAVFNLSSGKSLAGFYFFVNSTYAGGSDPSGAHAKTEVFNMTASLNGGSAISVPGLTADFLQSFVRGPDYFFTTPVNEVEFRGSLRFTWNAVANLNNERNKFTLKFIEGVVIPAPSGVLALAMGGLLAARRRR